ncbi:MAG: hypothetical protein AB7F59_05610 [Bdellovibrionales bacterium]
MKHLMILGILAALPAYAEAGNGSHGGDVFACFSIPLEKAVTKIEQGYLMTAEGRRALTKVQTVEFTRAEAANILNPVAVRHMNSPFEIALQAITTSFKEVPTFFQRIESARDYVGLIPDGLPAPNGLYDLKDEGINFPPEPNCVQLQAAIREGRTINFDRTLWEKMSGFQQALLQFHEEIYYIGVHAPYYHGTSARTQLLITHWLTGRKTVPATIQAFTSDAYPSVIQYATQADLKTYYDKALVAYGLTEDWLKKQIDACNQCQDWWENHPKDKYPTEGGRRIDAICPYLPRIPEINDARKFFYGVGPSWGYEHDFELNKLKAFGWASPIAILTYSNLLGKLSICSDEGFQAIFNKLAESKKKLTEYESQP